MDHLWEPQEMETGGQEGCHRYSLDDLGTKLRDSIWGSQKLYLFYTHTHTIYVPYGISLNTIN